MLPHGSERTFVPWLCSAQHDAFTFLIMHIHFIFLRHAALLPFLLLLSCVYIDRVASHLFFRTFVCLLGVPPSSPSLLFATSFHRRTRQTLSEDKHEEAFTSGYVVAWCLPGSSSICFLLSHPLSLIPLFFFFIFQLLALPSLFPTGTTHTIFPLYVQNTCAVVYTFTMKAFLSLFCLPRCTRIYFF